MEVVIGIIAVTILLALCTLIAHRAEKTRQKRWLEQVLGRDRIAKLTPDLLKEAENGIVQFDATGFSVSFRQRQMEYYASLNWEDVREIKTFKRDLFAIDLICWWFCCSDDDYRIEINEHMLGYDKLITAVQSRFTINNDWFGVAFPAFATNMTTVWQKQPA